MRDRIASQEAPLNLKSNLPMSQAVALPTKETKRAKTFVSPKQVQIVSPSQLMWRRFRKHKLAVISVFIVALFYLIALFADFVAPMDPNKVNSKWTFMPPQSIHFVHEGSWQWPPFIYDSKFTLD